jgi:hypothetical protein
MKSFLSNYVPKFKDTELKRKRYIRENLLYKIVQELFADQIVIQNHRHQDIVFHQSLRHGQLDTFVPFLMIALEYQGEQHFWQTTQAIDTQDTQKRDSEKRKICRSLGISLIEVPYWWNGSKDQLAATIQKYRPDLLTNFATSAQPIPTMHTSSKGSYKVS